MHHVALDSCTHTDIYCYSTFDSSYILYHQIYIYIRMIYVVFNIFNSFIPVIVLKTLIFRSSILFGTHILSDRSLRVLQLPMHLSKLTANGYQCNPEMYS